MKNLGNKLSDARIAMGYSVRDAADATRLRVDVIENMESGEFNYSLPEIYKRGFLRIYSSFLKLDTEQILEDYISVRSPNEEAKRQSILAKKQSVADFDTEPNYNNNTASFAPPLQAQDDRFEDDSEDAENQMSEQSAKFVKIASIFGGVILLVVIIIFIASTVFKKDEVLTENTDVAIQQQTQRSAISMNELDEVKPFNLSVTALDTTSITVYTLVPDSTGQNNTEITYFKGQINKGEVKEFTSKTTIMIRVVDAERLSLVRNNKKINLGNAKGLNLLKIAPVQKPAN